MIVGCETAVRGGGGRLTCPARTSGSAAQDFAAARRKTALDLGFADPERLAPIAQDDLHLRIAVETLSQGAHLALDPLALGMLLPAKLVALAL